MACINPSGEGYDVEELDPALLARFSALNVKADVKSWLIWAESVGVHGAVREFVRCTPKIFEPRESNPRAWVSVSDIVSAHENGNGCKGSLLALIVGKVGDKLGPAFLKFYSAYGSDKLPTPEQILKGYSRHRVAIQRFRDSGNTSALHSLTQQMLLHLQDSSNQRHISESKIQLTNCQMFVSDLPAEYRTRFQKHAGSLLMKGA
jgi:hypothetical protein